MVVTGSANEEEPKMSLAGGRVNESSVSISGTPNKVELEGVQAPAEEEHEEEDAEEDSSPQQQGDNRLLL